MQQATNSTGSFLDYATEIQVGDLTPDDIIILWAPTLLIFFITHHIYSVLGVTGAGKSTVCRQPGRTTIFTHSA